MSLTNAAAVNAAVVAERARETAHRAAMQASVQELAQRLEAVLSRRLTAYLVNVQDGRTIARWASGEITAIRDEKAERRLRVAYEIVSLLREASMATQTIRAWFISLNPRLRNQPPLEVIRDGNLDEAIAAAEAFVANP
ncbi:MAG: XRE family transcriptional regulator [Chloroflexota bacterium]|nr:XRE family transcriptional regulator [Chloroflexota bacterium]